jgi:flagellar export protein FliJ
MIADLERIRGDLEREVTIEQDRVGIHDPVHFAYPTYAKAAMARRENLKRSISELKIMLDDAKAALGEGLEEMKMIELLDERKQAEEQVGEQVQLNAVA